MQIDHEWFVEKISESSYGSMRQLAKAFKTRGGEAITHSNLSRVLGGTRPMLISEAVQFSDLLEVPLIEVLIRSGLNLPDPQVLTEALEFYEQGPGGRKARQALAILKGK